MLQSFRLEGSSMLPLFRPGDMALVEPFTDTTSIRIKAGDCAVYSYKGRNLLHRAIKVSDEGVWFSDDTGRLEPHFVPCADIRGKVLCRNPLAGGLCGRLYSAIRRAASCARRKLFGARP